MLRPVPTVMFLQRHKLGISLNALGTHPQVRIDPNFLSMCERFEAAFVPAQAERVARVLGVPPEDLLTPVVLTERELAALQAEVERLETAAAAR
jgi:hypothetical protein